MDLVSIITPTFNSSKFITVTINSVLKQTYKNWELILIDDASTDNTSEIISKCTIKDSRIKIIQLKQNGGAAEARNYGIKHAKGKYLAFLDSDDCWLPEKIEKQLQFMKANNIYFSYTDYFRKIENTGSENVFCALKDNIYYKDIIKFNYIACSTVMINIENSGKKYMPNITTRHDWGLWIDYIRETGLAKRLPIPLTCYLVRKGSLSSKKLKLIKYHWFIYNKHLKFNTLKAFLFLTRNIFLHGKEAVNKS